MNRRSGARAAGDGDARDGKTRGEGAGDGKAGSDVDDGSLGHGKAGGSGRRPRTPSALLTGPLRGATVGLLLVVSAIAFEGLAGATALPTAVRDLDGLTLYAWPFTGFLLASVLGLVLGGELADRTGPRRPVALGLVAFVAGLVVAGTAVDMPVFVAGRVVQGLGVGMIGVAVYVVVGEVYDDALRPRMFGLLSAAWVVPSLVGPVVAGTLAEHVSWRAAFLGVVPLAAVAAALVLPVLRRPRAPVPTGSSGGGGRARWPYALLAGVAVVLLQYAADRLDLLAAGCAVAGIALLVPAVRVLLPPGTVRFRAGLPAVVALRGLAAGAFFAVDALVPLTLTVVHGSGPAAAGIPLSLGSIGWAGASWWQGRHPDVGRHRLVAAGMVAIAVAAASMAVVAQEGTAAWLSYPTWIVGGLGMGLVSPSLAVLLLDGSPVAERGRNSAALQISDVLGSAVLIGLGGALVAASTRGALGSAGLSAAVGIVDVAMVAVALGGAALAARVRKPEGPLG